MKYPISKEYRLFRNIIFKPTENLSFYKIGNYFLRAKLRHLRSTKDLEIKKYQVKNGENSLLDLYLFNPKNIKTDKIILFLHGGGFLFAGYNYHFDLAKSYAKDGRAKVLYVDYRLSYLYKYPLPVNDCVLAYKWILANKDNLEIDINKIIICGDSAGGSLAIDTAYEIHKEGLKKPSKLLLIYPVVDNRMISTSMMNYTDTPLWNSRMNEAMWDMYIASVPYISPFARADFDYLDNVYIETAEFDCLHDEGIELYKTLKLLGNKVSLNETIATMHGFDIKICKTTLKAIERRIEEIKSVDN